MGSGLRNPRWNVVGTIPHDAVSDNDRRDVAAIAAALRGCVAGEGEAPLELLLAAAACAASGDVCGVPVRRLREDQAVGALDLSGYPYIGVTGSRLLAHVLPGATSLASLE